MATTPKNPQPLIYDSNDKRNDSVYSKRIRAGKRRTYFFDVRTTRGHDDYFLTITESRKRFDDNGYDRHKIFLYKEDFNKFSKALLEAVDHVKTELMPDFDFDAYSHEGDGEYDSFSQNPESQPPATGLDTPPRMKGADRADEPPKGQEDIDKW